MKKNILAAILICSLVGGITIPVLTAKAESNESQPVFQELPDTFSMDVTFKEIEQSILNYINEQKLDIQYGTQSYEQLLNRFLFEDMGLSEVRDTYYGDYAAYYFKIKQEAGASLFSSNDSNMDDEMNLTIQDLKDQNQALIDSFSNSQP